MTKKLSPSIEPGYREVRLTVPDARSPVVRRRLAKQIAKLASKSEADAMAWIEAVSSERDR